MLLFMSHPSCDPLWYCFCSHLKCLVFVFIVSPELCFSSQTGRHPCFLHLDLTITLSELSVCEMVQINMWLLLFSESSRDIFTKGQDVRRRKHTHTLCTHNHTHRASKTSAHRVIDMRWCTSAKHPFTRIHSTLGWGQTQIPVLLLN